MKRSRPFTPQWKKPPYPQQHLDVIWANGLMPYSIVINLGGLVALFHAPPFPCAHTHFLFLHHLLPAPTVSLHVLICLHPRLSPSPCVYFILQRAVLWQRLHSPDVCSQCLCHALMWYGGLQELCQHHPACASQTGWRGWWRMEDGWLLPTPCPVWWWWKHTNIQRGYNKVLVPQTPAWLKIKIRCWRN